MALADFELIDHFGDPAAEARACRSACALFEFSFIERAQVRGGAARQVIEAFTGRSLAQLAVGKICYALRVDAADHLLADLTVWRTGEETFEVMSGRHEDVVDLIDCARPGVSVTALADRATFAVQGPASLEALRRLGTIDGIEAMPYFNFTEAKVAAIPCRIGRLGYSGEPGFEIICPKNAAGRLWQTIAVCARPAGFIALDMLRIEAGLVLFCNEFRVPATPAEAGLGRFYDRVLPPPAIELISFIAAPHHPAWPNRPPGLSLPRPSAAGEIVVTSACASVVAGGIEGGIDGDIGGGVLGLGYVLAGHKPGAALHDPSGMFRDIRQTRLPFYDTAKRRPRLAWRH
jgi:glycine cleavage system T protein (aminomethyltransferase)